VTIHRTIGVDLAAPGTKDSTVLVEYQAVEIHLTDGRKAAFMGPVLVTGDDERRGVRIAQIRFIEARPLPEGYSFTEVPGSTSPATPPESSEGTRAPEKPQAPQNARPRARKPRRAR